MKKDAKRGYVPDDDRNFLPEALAVLKTASRHVCWLMDEGYDSKQATTFVGNHFLLSERQRLSIMRSTASTQQLLEREKKRITLGEISEKEVWIDGFNTVITLEVLLCDSILFTCMDGTLRDLASLRGTYRLIPETADAVKMMFDVLQEANIRKINILLDEPVSNSGRLKVLMAEIAENYPFQLDIQVRKDVDRELYEKELVITSDSVILDHCKSWVNLSMECLKRRKARTIQVWQEKTDEHYTDFL